MWVSVGLSVPCVCHWLLVEVWVCKSLCVSEPWGWKAEQLQVATRKSKQVRVGGCKVGRGWMKASEYTKESQGVSRAAGAEQAGGCGWAGEGSTEGGGVLLCFLQPSPGLTACWQWIDLV